MGLLVATHRNNINNVLIAGELCLAYQPHTIAHLTLQTVAAEPTLSTDKTQMSPTPTAMLPSLETTAITEEALLSPQQTSQLLLPESVVMPASPMTEASASTTSVEEETIAIAAPIEDSCAPPSTSQQATTIVSKVPSPASPEGAEKEENNETHFSKLLPPTEMSASTYPRNSHRSRRPAVHKDYFLWDQCRTKKQRKAQVKS
ncbi:uncharacterized protein LOC124799228 [Schistocerca piceifrons]|uniref:uncharacterized protein LOC124799228 n=1 Tax=Schistocerca piceifrons TaxID=274613 RepID=UPI001F5FE2BF|nr:uncharacterized protein LOC124799228 [Schistocerca piceifrons]XP_047118724.1 uncharacterized protein LOC124799228 [Schistocerca piceifrons]